MEEKSVLKLVVSSHPLCKVSAKSFELPTFAIVQRVVDGIF